MREPLNQEEIAELREETGMSVFDAQNLRKTQREVSRHRGVAKDTLEEKVAYLMSMRGSRLEADLEGLEKYLPERFKLDAETRVRTPCFAVRHFDETFLVIREKQTGMTIVLLPHGEAAGAEMVELDEGFRRGSVWGLLDSATSRVRVAGYDIGAGDFPAPASGERLCLVTREGLAAPAVMDSIARGWQDPEDAPEYKAAREVLEILDAADLGSFAITNTPSPG